MESGLIGPIQSYLCYIGIISQRVDIRQAAGHKILPSPWMFIKSNPQLMDKVYDDNDRYLAVQMFPKDGMLFSIQQKVLFCHIQLVNARVTNALIVAVLDS